ncbi:SDR family NAD(P)-dependent oxidoreductase [Nocardia australiensis]|uniref:SDR family NAD(P)-dependent oxidoreductase n=1 Tax=Nocardia australiensis TaxID=2887191 RepID=UPI001D133FC4|nr:SDR family oxidoreductase [Nocardia australiensis]
MTSPSETHADRVAVVTGAGRGIGRAIAVGLAQRGATVIAVDREPAEETSESIHEAGLTCFPVTADVSDPGDVQRLHDVVTQQFGTCDIVVNNAAISGAAPWNKLDYSFWRRVLITNLDSQFLVSTVFAQGMMEKGRGRIVNISSSSIYSGPPGLTAYLTSKAGVLGLTAGLSADLAPYGITVNAVSPPFTRTQMVDEGVAAGAFPPDIDNLLAAQQSIRRPGAPRDVVGAVCFLSGDEADFVTGQFIVVDGGLTRHF